MTTVESLSRKAFYAPWLTGKYSVAPGLRPLGTGFGNGDADGRLIQLDAEFKRYRENKLDCMAERPAKYWRAVEGSDPLQQAAFQAIAEVLVQDYPEHFSFSAGELDCALTGERVSVDDGLHGIAMQIQPDVAIIARHPDGSDYNAAMHICAPSHWAAGDKVGRSFFDSHVPVPHFEAVNAVAPRLVDTIISRGPFVRFVWGLESDDRLNHHPEAPADWDVHEWQGRHFDRGEFFVRTERQTILGLPQHDAALFFIHVQTIPGEIVLASEELRNPLRDAIASMSLQARAYKGIEEGFLDLMRMLS